MPPTVSISIEYCAESRWLRRATNIAQELLSTFQSRLREVCLVPSSPGTFAVRMNGRLVWSRSQPREFPGTESLKQTITDELENLAVRADEKRQPPEQIIGWSEVSAIASMRTSLGK